MTAVEYIQQEFLKKLTDENYNISFDEIIEQAKAMEKEQIINAHLEGWSDAYDYLQDNGSKPARQAEEYYNETYK